MVNKQLQYTYCPNSQSKINQAIKFGQVIECNKRNIFLQNHAENEAERLVPEALYEVKPSGLQLSFNNLAYNTNKLYKTLDY